jgi:hypothetical protein
MKKPETKATKSLMDRMQELGHKYGVKVTDMSERGVLAIGFLGGVRRQDQESRASSDSPAARGVEPGQ